MDVRLEYDHKYLRRMIEHEHRVNNEAVHGIINYLQKAIESNS